MATQEPLISRQKVASLLGKPGVITNTIASVVMPVTGISEFNRIAAKYPGLNGRDFARQALECFGVSIDIRENELSFIPNEGACIIVCNHPFGMVDGLTIIDRISDIRPDTKILTNYLLSLIEPLDEFFMPVNPFEGGKHSSLQGIKMAKEHLENGGVLVLFPAGEVSSDCNEERIVKDIPWQTSMMKLIQHSAVPVVPLYFHGQNSARFHRMGHIHPSLRTVRLVKEALNKQGTVVPVRIGKPIPASEYAGFTDLKKMAAWLYNRTYVLEAEVADDKTIAPIAGEPVEAHVPVETLLEELRKNAADHLFTSDKYEVYFSRYENIPNMINELGICREETFRAVGEGTGSPKDLDKYDEYYGHLYIWDSVENELVGSYRFGMGKEIMEKYGIHGFYSDSLFRYDEKMAPVLRETLELGRSFVHVKHQKSPLPLMLLMEGIFAVALKHDWIKYYCGPVTTSGAYPIFYRSLMLKYMRDYHSSTEFKSMVSPIDPFVPDFGRVNLDDLLAGRTFETVEHFDRYMMKLSSGRYRMPTLVKKYLRLGVKVLDFNVDPTFNYCVDSLIFIRLSDFTKDDVDGFTKDIEDRDFVYKRLGTKLN